MTKDEALRLALEALKEITRRNQSDHQAEIAEEAITAIKAALEAKDEPWEQFYPEMGKPKLVEVQDGKCKRCTDGCPACDARKLPEQEPVAWRAKNFYQKQEGWFYVDHLTDLIQPKFEPLYTTPPQRTWVGLTDEDFYGQSELQVMAMKYAEAKLKEKNT